MGTLNCGSKNNSRFDEMLFQDIQWSTVIRRVCSGVTRLKLKHSKEVRIRAGENKYIFIRGKDF
jgi:hypothetical protein